MRLKITTGFLTYCFFQLLVSAVCGAGYASVPSSVAHPPSLNSAQRVLPNPSKMAVLNERIGLPSDSLQIRCDSITQNSIIFRWNNVEDALGYRVQVGSDPFLILQDSFLAINNLLPSDSISLIVEALSPHPGGDRLSDTLLCIARGCPDLSIDFAPIDTLICLDANTPPLQLLALVAGGSGINARQRWTGPGVDTDNNLFYPSQVGEGTYWLRLSYEEKGPCGITDSLQIRIFSIPTGPFTLSANQVCLGDTASIAYVGNAGADAILDWTFGSADTIGGMQDYRAPFGLVFPSEGLYPIQLRVTENGCSDITSTASDTIRVTAPLPAVSLRCGPASLNSLSFQWQANTPNSTYLLQGQPGGIRASTDTFFRIENLLPGDAAQLIVREIGDFPCGNGPADTLSCSTLPCPAVQFDLSGIDTLICNYTHAGPVNLTTTILGDADPQALLRWEGPGIPVGTAMFDPRLVGPGDYTLLLTYAGEGPCLTRDSIRMRVLPVPSVAVDISEENICEGSSIQINFIGDASDTATFSWTFPGATILSGAGRGPYQIQYNNSGDYPIGLLVSDNGCDSQAGEQVGAIRVDRLPQPIAVRCGPAAYDRITLHWEGSEGASSYRVSRLDNGQSVVQQDTVFTLSGLAVDTRITFVITPLSGNICGEGPSDTLHCETLACPSVQFDFSSLPSRICATTQQPPIPLPLTVAGEDSHNRIEWTGTSVREINGQYYFQPIFAGVGTFLLQANYEGVAAGCQADSSFLLQVLPPPLVNAGEDQVLDCRNSSLVLSGSGIATTTELSYQWSSSSPSAPMLPSPSEATVSVTSPGIYTLRVSDENGCSNTDQVLVLDRTEAPRATLEVFPISCAGDRDGLIAILDIEGGQAPFELFFNEQPSLARSFSDLGPGNYQLRITDQGGCSFIQTIALSQPEPLQVSIRSSTADLTAVPFGTPIDLVANIFGGSTIDTIQWRPEGVGLPSFNRLRLAVEAQRTIEVTVTDERGCRASDRVLVSPATELPVFIPSAFSPNGDNINDRFFIYADSRQVASVEELSIFDRWGERVFQQSAFPPNDPRFGWDGQLDGRKLQAAVFVYYVALRLQGGELLQFKGSLHLLR